MKNPSKTNTTIIFAIEVLFVFSLYFVCQLSGYFFFGEEIEDDFLVNFPANNYLAVGGRVGALFIAGLFFFF